MKRVRVDKIASATARLAIPHSALVTDRIEARAGVVIAVRVLDHKEVYDKLEDTTGRMVKLYPGDVVVGVLGSRRALHGHAGVVPEVVAVGDTLHMLNLGGVIGRCVDSHPSVGSPLRVEVLGAVLTFPVVDSRAGVPATIRMNALDAVDALPALPPMVIISGTSMDTGKTRVACEAVRHLTRAGRVVGAAKLTGVALRQDLLRMQDCGAIRAFSFADAGLASTERHTAPAAARAVLAALGAPGVETPDVIVVELGDGLLGEYGVMEILTQPDLSRQRLVHVCCASDPVGAFGACALFEQHLGRRPDVFSGPVTDHDVGKRAIRERLDLPAFNAITESAALGEAIGAALTARLDVAAPLITQETPGAAPPVAQEAP